MNDRGASLPLAHAGAREAQVTAWRGGAAVVKQDWLADEVPVALVFNGISHAVMLASPLDLEDFALGFGLSEGLLAHPGEMYGAEVVPGNDGIELLLDVAGACEHRLKSRRRQMSGRTGCGLCGTDSLAQVIRPLPPLTGATTVTPAAVARSLQSIRAAQRLQHRTGATHAAAWCNLSGEAVLVREDVGRHNALDKLIGAMVRAHQDPAQGFVTLTSRASLEMVQKTVMAGVGVLAAVSAPTALAVDVARRAGLALAGFARGDDFVCYAHPERFGLTRAADGPTTRTHGVD
jgi:FdhD protein